MPKDFSGLRNPKNGKYIRNHGMKYTKIYRVWCAMKERCNNSHNKHYKHYGAKGISVCEDWSRYFLSFYEWAMSNGYKEGLTIDRINSNGNYCPENCRWVTQAQQNRNYSRNHFLTFKGETLCLKDMAIKYGIKPATLLFRLKTGNSIEESLSPIDKRTTRWKKQKTSLQNSIQLT